MPSRKAEAAPRLCFMGDSHLGAVKRALDAGLLPLDPARTGFWGVPGPAFRKLRLQPGPAIAADPGVRDLLATVRGDGPEVLRPTDYDAFVFYGARVRLAELLRELHDHAVAYGAPSQAVVRLGVERWLAKLRGYRFARSFAEAGVPVALIPVAFPTEGILPAKRAAREARIDLTAPVVQSALSALRAQMAADRVVLVEQPAETLTDHGLTQARFAPATAAENRDPSHKNADYAATMVDEALAALDIDRQSVARAG